jgi:hypothetical protein
MFPTKPEWRKRCAQTMINYYGDPKNRALTLQDFLDTYGIKRKSWDRWAAEFEDLRDCWEQIKPTLGNRRYRGAAFMDSGMRHEVLMKDIHNYSDEWKAINAYHAQLKQLDENKPTSVVVRLNPVKKTDEIVDCPDEYK